MSKLISTGCSFTAGDGLVDREESVYGKLVADKLGLNFVNLGYGGASNLHIALQVDYALRVFNDIDTILIGATSYSRFNLAMDNIKLNLNSKNFGTIGLENFFDKQLISTNVNNFDLSDTKRSSKHKFIPLKGPVVSNYRLQTLKNNVMDNWEKEIQMSTDFRVLGFEALRAINSNINIIIISQEKWFRKYFENNTVNFDFFSTAIDMPDSLGTQHMNEQAHEILANQIIKLYSHLKTTSNDY